MTVPAPLARLVALVGENAPLLLAEAAAMTRFFSRLPLPRLGKADDPASPPPFARALRMLPLASLMIAAPAALIAALLAASPLSSLAAAAVTVTAMTLATGAFHEDGLADVADAFAGGRDAARRLEIMKDSRIGAYGGTALAAQFVLRTSLLADLIEVVGPRAGLLVLVVAALARTAALGLAWLLPNARADGLASSVGRPETVPLAIGLGTALALFLVIATTVAGPAEALMALGLALAALAGLAALARAKIGGVTGDVIGAGVLVAEIALLLGLAL